MSLTEAATHLEIRLLKRIAELETVNAQLNDEITKHKHTEEELHMGYKLQYFIHKK